MTQYALPISLPPVFSADNFFVSDCNKEAWQWIDAWPHWPAHALLLYGPEGSGKTHLGHIWAAKAKAKTLSADALEAPASALQGNWLIEDTERAHDERNLLHWFNYIRENGGNLLLTSSLPAAKFPFTLLDLTSRLLALPTAPIGQPDDAVLAAAMRKQFADRQIKVDEEVIAYVVPRMERSLGRLKELVERLDAGSLAQGRALTVPLVRRLWPDAV